MSTDIDIVSVREAAEQRHSIRAYAPGPIPRGDLAEILRQTSLAPSAWNLQPWRFLVVENPAEKDRLKAAAYNQPQVGAAPAVFVLYTDMADTLATLDQVARPEAPAEKREGFIQMVKGAFANQAPEQQEAWGAIQGGIALGYLLLAAQGMGYATSAMGGFEPEKVKALFGLPENVRVVALVAIGRAAEKGLPHHRHGVEKLAKFV